MTAGQKVLMPFVCGGHPDSSGLGDLLRACERGGAGIVEVGIPFSDPIADGPVIAAAMHRAISNGVTPDGILNQIAEARPSLSVGIVLMVSVSLVLASRRSSNFLSDSVQAGVDGFIFPDLPLEESQDLVARATELGAAATLLVSPSTHPDRIARITSMCSGFVYVLARAGITGERRDAPSIGPLIQSVRRTTQLPVACGFGITSAEHVRSVAAHADGVIVGSALIRRLGDASAEGRDVSADAEAFLRELGAELG
jgi:tryptophan synthase alpha chain